MSGMTVSSRSSPSWLRPHALPRRGESVRAHVSRCWTHEAQDQNGGAVGARRHRLLGPPRTPACTLGMPAPATGPIVRRRVAPYPGARPPPARHRHAHRRSSRPVKPVRPAACRALTPSRTAPAPDSHTALPPGPVDREGAGADDHGVGAGSGPAPGSHLGAHVGTAHPARAQVPAVRDPAVVSGQASRHGGSLRARHAAPGLLGHRATLARMAGGSLTPCGQLVCAMQRARSGAPSASHRPSLSG